jgi:hypothetical protein
VRIIRWPINKALMPPAVGGKLKQEHIAIIEHTGDNAAGNRGMVDAIGMLGSGGGWGGASDRLGRVASGEKVDRSIEHWHSKGIVGQKASRKGSGRQLERPKRWSAERRVELSVRRDDGDGASGRSGSDVGVTSWCPGRSALSVVT